MVENHRGGGEGPNWALFMYFRIIKMRIGTSHASRECADGGLLHHEIEDDPGNSDAHPGKFGGTDGAVPI